MSVGDAAGSHGALIGVLLGGLQGGFDIAEVVEGVEDTDHVDAVFDGQLHKLLHLSTMDKAGYYSVECWGGATFDSCLRYLGEDPWERLRNIRKWGSWCPPCPSGRWCQSPWS